jgi:hypothetical protein
VKVLAFIFMVFMSIKEESPCAETDNENKKITM